MTVMLTFNGDESLALPDGATLHGAVTEESGNVELWNELPSGERLWDRPEILLGPDPRAIHAKSDAHDCVATFWTAADAVVLLGWRQAVVVDRGTGNIRAILPVRFVGKSSIDVAGLHVLADGRLLVVSTRRVLVIGSDLSVEVSHEPKGPLAADPQVIGNNVVMQAYDLEGPPGAIVEEELELLG